MTIYYTGPGGSDGANGLSYATRKLSLNGCEDIPLVAGDQVYVSPGVYRELLTCDVSGTAGNPITYIADVSGEKTDGIGGPVRITGSNDDQTITRASCISASSRSYRTFRGFAFDTTSGNMVTLLVTCNAWIIEDCYFGLSAGNLLGVAGTGIGTTIRRCLFLCGKGMAVNFIHTANVDNSGHVVENCLVLGGTAGNTGGIRIDRIGGVTIRHCTILFGINGIRVFVALTTGQTTTVQNCIIAGCGIALQSITLPATNEEITENYNSLSSNNTDRSQVTAGANSNTFPPVFEAPMQVAGMRYPWNSLDLSQWSALRALAGANMSADDMLGITRPTTDSKKSWGAIQYNDIVREVTTKRGGAASMKLADAGRLLMIVPVGAVSTTFSCFVQWEANYAGTLPSLIIRQPGQSATTVTAVGSSGVWELLTTTLTPAAAPTYVQVELRSSNTATSGAYASYWEDVTVA